MGTMTKEMITSSDRPRRPGERAWLAVAAVACGGAALIAGCSSTSTSAAANHPSPAKKQSPMADTHSPDAMPTESKAVCVHINSLRTSLTDVTHVKFSATSATKLSSDLSNIQTQLNALKGKNLGAFSAQASQLSASLDKIKKDAAQMSTNPTAAAKSLSTDLTQLKTKAGPIIIETNKVCHMK